MNCLKCESLIKNCEITVDNGWVEAKMSYACELKENMFEYFISQSLCGNEIECELTYDKE